jgi:hypothetical protein
VRKASLPPRPGASKQPGRALARARGVGEEGRFSAAGRADDSDALIRRDLQARLQRFYDVQDGQIRINAEDIKRVTEESLRSAIA